MRFLREELVSSGQEIWKEIVPEGIIKEMQELPIASEKGKLHFVQEIVSYAYRPFST